MSVSEEQNQVLTISETQQPVAVGTADMLFLDGMLERIERFAILMAKGVSTVPDHLRDKPADCMAVTMQAAQWRMNPFAVAQKTHLVNGQLGYEAQLVNAVVSTSRAIRGRFHYEYGDDSGGLWCKVGAVIAGESDVTWGEPVYQNTQKVQNSTLWKTNPKQQIGYLAVKMWCRQYTPAVILGVYTPEEIKEIDMGDVDVIQEPATHTESVKSKLEGKASKATKPKLSDIIKAIDNSDSKAELDRAVAHAGVLPDTAKRKARQAYSDKLKAISPTPPTYADIADRINSATLPNEVTDALDLSNELPADQRAEIQALANESLGKIG